MENKLLIALAKRIKDEVGFLDTDDYIGTIIRLEFIAEIMEDIASD